MVVCLVFLRHMHASKVEYLYHLLRIYHEPPVVGKIAHRECINAKAISLSKPCKYNYASVIDLMLEVCSSYLETDGGSLALNEHVSRTIDRARMMYFITVDDISLTTLLARGKDYLIY